MASFRFSERAALDVQEILAYSINQFGIERTEQYKTGLDRCFGRVAVDQRLGRQLTGRSKSYWRYICQRHIVYYLQEKNGILIVRVLHDAMDHRRHLP